MLVNQEYRLEGESPYMMLKTKEEVPVYEEIVRYLQKDILQRRSGF